MSGLLFEAAAAADIVRSSPEQCAAMLRHHLVQAHYLADKLGMKMAAHDVCQILKWLDG